MVTVIFTNFKYQEFFQKLNKFIKNNRAFKYTVYGILCSAAVYITVIASGVTVGYAVKYSDRVIAVVSSESDFEKADAIVVSGLDDNNAKKASISPKYCFTLTVADNLNTTNEIVEAIIDNNDEIVEAYALFVDGEIAFCTENAYIEKVIDNRLQEFYVDGAENSSNFKDDVKFEKGYHLKSNLVDVYTAADIVNTLDVETVSVTTNQVEIPFETKNVKTNKKEIGYSAVTQKGENGISEKTEKLISLNGKTVSKEKLGEKTVKEQVTEIVTVGTGVKYVSPTAKLRAKSAGFICPISRGKFLVSAYYGDGRNHQAIDLAADKGTPIFAAASGKITFVGYDSQYGYNVIIEHSNGIKTRYAHANALCVKKGDTVSQGDMIATVGMTGYATGNHLHFEVIVNGNRVNPAPYIGL